MLAGLIGAPAAADVPHVAAAAKTCTGWITETVPPDTIRVFRTAGPAKGTVQTVPFRQYVNTVIASEWGSSNPPEGLKVGAIAVKQYAWHRTVNWRGKTAPDGTCYDIVDSTLDQLYEPETHAPQQSQIDAIDATWSISLHSGGHLISTGYRTGSSVACGADADGKILYQQSVYRCAKDGLAFDAILHRYLDPGLEIVGYGSVSRTRATGDVTGDGVGDVMVVSPGADPAITIVRVYGAAKVDLAPGAVTAPGVVSAALGLAPAMIPLAPADTAFRQFVDLTGDGLDDMVALQRAGAGYQIWLAAATGAGFGLPALLWSTDGSDVPVTPTVLVRLVAGDFDGDGRPDVALLAGEPGPPSAGAPVVTIPTPIPSPGVSPPAEPTPAPSGGPVLQPPQDVTPIATLWLLRGTGTGLAPAEPWWSGPLNLQGTTAFGGDIDGDGRADLAIQMDMTKQMLGATGLREIVVRSGAAPGSSPETWADLPDTPATAARTVIADVNGDGRSDLVVDRIAGTVGSQMLGLLSTGSSFAPKSLWANARSFRWAASRIASVDANADGRDDIAILYNAGAAGSRLYRFLSTGTTLRSAGATTDPTLPWAGAAPY